MKKLSFVFTLLLSLALLFTGCTASSAEQNSLLPSSNDDAASSDSGKYFFATVTDTKSDFGGILVDPEDETLGGALVVHSEDMPTLSKGERVKVIYDGQIALSYPGQIFGAKVIPQK